MPERHEPGKSQGAAADHGAERTAAEHEPQVNQYKHEPYPASHHASPDESAAAGHEQDPVGRKDSQAAPGKAIRDMMGGPQPPGDVPGAPATQIATAETEGDQPGQVRYVANAVPGKPDGEVDTRS